jgi:hypothetical protein
MTSIRSTSRTLAACAAAVIGMTPLTLDAQAQPRTRFGALIGLSSTSITDADVGDFGEIGVNAETKRRMGFQLGAYLTQALTNSVSFQPEIHYIQKGAKVSVTVTDIEGVQTTADAEASVKLAYLEVPLLLRLDMGSEGGSVRPFLLAGPAVALRISCNLGLGVEGASFNTDCAESFEDETESDDPFKKFDAGIMVGGGVAGTMGSLPVSLQVRYSYGLINIARDPIDNRSPKNTGISLLFGIGF